jgi:hypothetical protein
MQQLQGLPNLVFLQPEFATTAVPIALGAGGLMSLQSGGAGSNTALITFNSAHGYTQTQNKNGTTLIQNATTNHGPANIGGTQLDSGFTYFQLTGATVNTAVNGITIPILAIPSTTTMLVYLTLTGTNPTVTAASFLPVFALQYGEYNIVLGANCAVQYNPDNTGSPILPPNLALPGTPVFRTLLAASGIGQVEFEGLALQTLVIANGSAGTSRWSQYFR